MDEAGAAISGGATGEVVIRGANVTAGYENNPEANAASFTNGWFRTGDQGYLNAEGYLYLTGRLKELINRGGEKISPREVDEVLLQHPAVAQALAFAVPHDRLGEEVAAAIVLADGAEAGERELREYASRHLADFKVPKRIVFVPEIPRGPTGKLQRIGLAAKLGLE
jgi:acyl-CoA synthetase (AMP-forming)/AMP-acid ligase II